jgi:RNA polymerase sigma factor (sigma-70 family)
MLFLALERWCKFRDEKARDRIAGAHLRMVPPIARKIASKFGFSPSYGLLPPGQGRDARTGYHEVISELTGEGNLALMEALEHFDIDQGFQFSIYARTCVSNAIVRHAKALRSVVDRPFDRPAPWDLSIDPQKPDPIDTREGNVGSRARPTVSDDPEDDPADNDPAGNSRSVFPRLRPPPKEPELIFRVHDLIELLPDEERHVMRSRIQGQSLKEIALDLDISTTTVWRRQQTAIEKLRVIQ